MKKFVAEPCLPHLADSLIIGQKYADKLDKKLRNLGITPVYVPNNYNVDERLSGHADLSFFHAGGERLFLAPYLKGSSFAEKLTETGAIIEYICVKQSKKYPNDAQLNLCRLKDHFLFSPDITSSTIVNYLTNMMGLGQVPVKQGYIKCSVCPVDSRSLITADRGIARAAQTAGLDVLLVAPGYVALPGFEYGFIGGAAFRLSDRVMAFTGRLDGHPDKMRILDFLSLHGLMPIYLTDEPIFDIGSAFPLTEA